MSAVLIEKLTFLIITEPKRSAHALRQIRHIVTRCLYMSLSTPALAVMATEDHPIFLISVVKYEIDICFAYSIVLVLVHKGICFISVGDGQRMMIDRRFVWLPAICV